MRAPRHPLRRLHTLRKNARKHIDGHGVVRGPLEASSLLLDMSIRRPVTPKRLSAFPLMSVRVMASHPQVLCFERQPRHAAPPLPSLVQCSP